MKKNLFFIGLDIAEADFAASIYQTPDKPIVTKEAIPNNPEGFDLFLLRLELLSGQFLKYHFSSSPSILLVTLLTVV